MNSQFRDDQSELARLDRREKGRLSEGAVSALIIVRVDDD